MDNEDTIHSTDNTSTDPNPTVQIKIDPKDIPGSDTTFEAEFRALGAEALRILRGMMTGRQPNLKLKACQIVLKPLLNKFRLDPATKLEVTFGGIPVVADMGIAEIEVMEEDTTWDTYNYWLNLDHLVKEFYL